MIFIRSSKPQHFSPTDLPAAIDLIFKMCDLCYVDFPKIDAGFFSCCLALIKPQSPRITSYHPGSTVSFECLQCSSLFQIGLVFLNCPVLSALLGPRARRSTTLSCQPPSGQCWPLKDWREAMGMGMFVHSQESRYVNKTRCFEIFVDQLCSLDTPLCPYGLCSKCL